jgi:FPC/CPF motif-containing protein YcgG
LVSDASFPCLGAKASLNADSFLLLTYEELASSSSSEKLHGDLLGFTQSTVARTSEYASFIAVFRRPKVMGERTFERLLWSQLQQLHERDKEQVEWDPNVSSDPDDPRFSFSIGGHAYYVIGLHAQSSRFARRFPWPALVFNPHAQFEKLRSDGKWKRMQETIRERDLALQGSVNPMLSDFGETSEARQYSGRNVEPDWHPDFRAGAAKAGRCPFAH